jgi:hypothetical protein
LLPNFAKFYNFCENIFSENFLKSAKRIFAKEKIWSNKKSPKWGII